MTGKEKLKAVKSEYVEMNEKVIKSYKGFNKDMTCRGFKYEEGEEYETETANVCYSGFHACQMPLEVLQYYQPSKSIYHEVEQRGDISKSDDGSTKVASTKIKIGASIGIKSLVNAQIGFVFKKSKNENNATSGDGSSAATSGNESSAATSGNGSSAVTSGYGSSAATFNKNGIAMACGKNSKAKGVIGSYIVLTEWNDTSDELIEAKMIRVDGKKIKADTWYKLKSGDFVECEVKMNGKEYFKITVTGKECFKAVKNALIDEIVTIHDIDKDTAYKALAEVLSDNEVWSMVSVKIADKLKKAPWNSGLTSSSKSDTQTVERTDENE